MHHKATLGELGLHSLHRAPPQAQGRQPIEGGDRATNLVQIHCIILLLYVIANYAKRHTTKQHTLFSHKTEESTMMSLRPLLLLLLLPCTLVLQHLSAYHSSHFDRTLSFVLSRSLLWTSARVGRNSKSNRGNLRETVLEHSSENLRSSPTTHCRLVYQHATYLRSLFRDRTVTEGTFSPPPNLAKKDTNLNKRVLIYFRIYPRGLATTTIKKRTHKALLSKDVSRLGSQAALRKNKRQR